MDLSGLNLSTLPDNWPRELQRARSLDSLDTSISVAAIDFSRNCLQGVPRELFTAQFAGSLRTLVLAHNELGGRVHRDSRDPLPLVPPCIKCLDLASNKLSARELDDLLTGSRGGDPSVFSLLHLLAPYNLLDSLPAALTSHTQLREVRLSFNRLTSLRSLDFARFPQLSILDVSNNQVSELGNVHEARALQTLLLENNALRQVPPELALLEQVSRRRHLRPGQTVVHIHIHIHIHVK